MDNQALLALIQKARSHAQQGRWAEARVLAIAAAETALATDNFVALRMAGNCLEKLDALSLASRYLAMAGRGLKAIQEPEWDGTPLPHGKLLIEQRLRDLGDILRTSRLVALAAERVHACELRINPRFVTLFQRSFPTVQVVSSERDVPREEVTAVASFESLSLVLTPELADVELNFGPLVADKAHVEMLHGAYELAAPGLPLIGLSWATRNGVQDVPKIEAWCSLLRRLPATFVSLQYGQVTDDIEEFGRFGVSVIHDPSVDALGDLDPLAAQVAAVDGVITISNTTAHMAGALGVRTIVLLDDLFHLFWSVSGSTTPWYPSMFLMRKQKRDWSDVFSDTRFETFLGLGRDHT